MLAKLFEVLPLVSELVTDPARWDSLVVNRRKPHTYRVFTTLDSGLRVCLHRFNPCDTHEAFVHPHPWPGAFLILDGRYDMQLSRSGDRRDVSPTVVTNLVMAAGSAYEITDPLVWHAVVPQMVTHTIMVNGPAWPADVAHESVRRTAGKDLEKLPADELLAHLGTFRGLLERYV